MSRDGVPAGPINDTGAAFVTATALGLEPVVATESASGDVQHTVRSPIGLSATPPVVRRGAPALGEHDAELRAWWVRQDLTELALGLGLKSRPSTTGSSTIRAYQPQNKPAPAHASSHQNPILRDGSR